MVFMSLPSFGDYLRHLRSASPAGRASKSGLLSRTQLAAGASMSVGYVIKLEQGKACRPSPDVIDRIAATLGISAVESRHLHDLADYNPAEGDIVDNSSVVTPVTLVMKEVVENLRPHLAAYVDEKWDILYSNREYDRIYRNITTAGNILKWLFFTPESRSVMIEWEAEARLTVAWFRALMVRRPGNTKFNILLDDLANSREFCQMWEMQEIRMGRHSPHMLVRDLDSGEQVRLLAQVYAWPDPTQEVQMYLGIRHF
jgi:transcriptional regulator with XRE-family HTH domain